MKYVVDCRRENIDGQIKGTTFRGCGAGLPDKKTANTVFNREVNSGKWDVVYMEKCYANGTLIDVKNWCKEGIIL
jgi:hypothetical protein